MNKFLVIKLDQYAGNVDEIVSTALTGWGNERYGGSQAMKTFNACVRPLLSEPQEEYCDLPIQFLNFPTEHGYSAYDLDRSSTNSLRMGIDDETTKEELTAMLDIWSRAYGDEAGGLKITVEGVHKGSVTVKILGFELVTVKEFRETLR